MLAQFELLSTFVMNNFLTPFADKIIGYMSKGIVFYAITFAIVAVVVFIIWRFLIHFKTTNFYRKLLGVLKGFMEGLNTIRRLKSKGWFVAHTIILWSCYTLMAYFCFSVLIFHRT